MSSYYVTTPIYYVNGEPHIGHAYTTIVADMLARYHRQRGDEVFFMTGTDEHGLKVQREAEAQGIAPSELAERNSSSFRSLFDKFEIQYDRFIRTTDEDHHQTVLALLERLKANDDIYLGTYSGWYAAADEAFFDESEIEDGYAISSGSKVEWVEEESYFFRLSKYEEPLLAWYRDSPTSVLPEARRNEVASFVEGGLNDLSISRTTFDWGIPFPDDPEHVLYVWLDALTNYITGVGAFREPEQFERFWPCDVHIIGKDILRFHAVYWPAFLMSAGIEPPRCVFAHGWWLSEGLKMSKSLGNFLDAFALADDYELDVLRYYLLREIPFGNDGNFVQARLVGRNNSELADNLGNLVNRTFKMLHRFLDGTVPSSSEVTEVDRGLVTRAEATRDAVDRHLTGFEPHRALEEIFGLSSDLNLYLQENQPWKLAKDEEQAERLAQVLYHTLEGIRWVATLLLAFLPDASSTILAALGQSDEEARSLQTLASWGGLAAGVAITIPEVLFTKLELPEEPEEEPEPVVAEKKPEQSRSEGAGLIDFSQFQSVEMRLGLIREAEKVEGADKLLKLRVDVGEEEPRTVVAGIAKSYAPEELVGKKVAVVTNLKPAKLFGILSEAMLLAADTEDGGLELASFSGSIAPGTRIS